ncbi:MAG TPA: 1-deoxy-D-xylulose-5-phosphate synthase N-terminal domain-containing protein, partial [Candidatus Cloacimonadota bacterium]|nr:1-deoxy-D-xylulose-5-phosphate synthase N-terminal domain-containing protein [Candidatus Cloacimonadota bacterium]
MILDRIHSSEQIKSLSNQDLQSLASEVRQRIVEVVASTGGH